jgi:hypothetical protein
MFINDNASTVNTYVGDADYTATEPGGEDQSSLPSTVNAEEAPAMLTPTHRESTTLPPPEAKEEAPANPAVTTVSQIAWPVPDDDEDLPDWSDLESPQDEEKKSDSHSVPEEPSRDTPKDSPDAPETPVPVAAASASDPPPRPVDDDVASLSLSSVTLDQLNPAQEANLARALVTRTCRDKAHWPNKERDDINAKYYRAVKPGMRDLCGDNLSRFPEY